MSDQVGNESPTSFNGPRQILVPKRILLATFGAAGGAGGVVGFRVETPDARVRCRVSVVGIPTPGVAVDFCFGKGLKIWLGELDDDQSGTSGVGVPVTNIIPNTVPGGVPRTTPLAFPVTAGLGGYSKEILTIGDAVEGEITIPAQGATALTGSLVLQMRYQPDQQRLPWPEWDEIRRQANGALIGSVVKT